MVPFYNTVFWVLYYLPEKCLGVGLGIQDLTSILENLKAKKDHPHNQDMCLLNNPEYHYEKHHFSET